MIRRRIRILTAISFKTQMSRIKMLSYLLQAAKLQSLTGRLKISIKSTWNRSTIKKIIKGNLQKWKNLMNILNSLQHLSPPQLKRTNLKKINKKLKLILQLLKRKKLKRIQTNMEISNLKKLITETTSKFIKRKKHLQSFISQRNKNSRYSKRITIQLVYRNQFRKIEEVLSQS